ncbi:MAG: calcium:proton antiporter [Verrucomicrobiota bacterium]
MSESKGGFWREEAGLWAGATTTAVFYVFGKSWLSDFSNGWVAGALFLWLFIAIMWLAFGVVRHAECLAIRLGEPYGTLILTVSVIAIETAMIASVMLTGENNPTLARDTMFSIIMIVLNGMLGVTLLVGGMRHHEQSYNLTGVFSYLGVLTPLAVLALVVPRYTLSTADGSVSPLLGVYLILMSGGLYAAFLLLQMQRHRGFFVQPAVTGRREAGGEVTEDGATELHGDRGLVVRGTGYHSLLLVLSMLPIVLLSKNVAKLVDYGISNLGAPQALGGFLVAILVLSPEGMSAIRAARANQLQRTVNIALGSTTSTIGMTLPVVLTISFVTGRHLELGLQPLEIVLLALTLLTCVISFGTGRTNVQQGIVHLVLFATYVVLIFD